MNCRKCERLVSRSMDGELPAVAARQLEVHLAGCPPCRAYRARLERIQTESRAPGDTPVPAGYWDDFSARLSARLEPARAEGSRRRFRLRGWRWAWVALPAAAAGVLIVLQLFRPGPVSVIDPFNQEGRLASAGLAVLEDPELAGELDSLVIAAIREETGFLSLDELPPLADDPGFWDSLTDDEAALLDREIAEELKS